jgi:hypothetical protein
MKATLKLPIADCQLRFKPQLSAFSLVEIIVAVGLLSFIMLGLLMAFNQTQRAFRTGITQVDVLESGRAVTSLLSSELQQNTPSYDGAAVNFYATNYFVSAQALPGTVAPNVFRTNVLGEVFFLIRENQKWIGVGYRVGFDNGLPAGTLYRYTTNVSLRYPSTVFVNYNATQLTNMSRVVEGVVHFRVRAFDTNGIWINPPVTAPGPGGNYRRNIRADWSGLIPNEIAVYGFTNNAVPASVEFELGILEDRTFERLKSIPDAAAQRAFLTNQAAGSVHIFRQRVAIRNVDPAAYQ